MFSRGFLFLIFSLLLSAWLGAQSYISGEDEAFYDSYVNGWESGQSGGRGFGEWSLFVPKFAEIEGEEQYAGFFIAEESVEGNLGRTAREGKAFGIFANGTGFEETVAFRAFGRPLGIGDIFSLRFKFEDFVAKFDRNSDATASVGIALRTEARASGIEALTEGRALVLAAMEGFSTYQILDGEGRLNTRIFLDPEGVELGFTLREDSRYDLQLTTLSNNEVHYFEGRPLLREEMETAGSPHPASATIRSFALFNLNGGVHNAYYGAFQISRQEEIVR